MNYRGINQYDLKEASDEATVKGTEPSLTVQAMAEEADINVLMHRYGITGKFPENPRIPTYGDFEHITDFRSALAAVTAAEHTFMEYPATFRARFENNPQLFLQWAADPSSRPEMAKLGMLNPQETLKWATPTTPAQPQAPPDGKSTA